MIQRFNLKRANLALFLIYLAMLSTVSSQSVTSPDVCLSILECPTNTFCNNTNFSQLPRCTRLLPENAICNTVGLSQCKQGFTCIFDGSILSTGPTCRRRAPRGAECRLDATRPCAGSLICERNTTTCQPFTDGFTGTPCDVDRHCQQDKGFYCQTGPGVCAPKRGPGGQCDRRADNFECFGFCVSRSFNDGICLSARREGHLCTENQECENRFFRGLGPRADTLICNVPKGVIGRCVRESRLLKRLGVECDPDQDRCDARRALSCRPTRRGGHVCQHRVSRFDRPVSEFCEPQNRLSRCPWDDEKTECRLERVVPGRFVPAVPSPFFACIRRSERVARGGICVAEYAACAAGTECREVPGVQPEASKPLSPLQPPRFAPFPPPRVAFCVRIVEQGGTCDDVKDKFTTQCGEGLRCEKGTCVKAEMDEAPLNEAVTFAGLRAFCEDLPCVPGLVCEKGEFESRKRCLLPLRVVDIGEPCTNRATERRRCANGLVCALRKDGTNVKRCRKPRKAGDYCQEDNNCDKGLVCPSVWTANREQEERRCYDPRMTLNLGQTCDPKASGAQPRCVVNERPDDSSPRDTILEPMRCVMKGDVFACRVVVQLFEFCDEARDVTCDRGQKCGSLGVCVADGEN